IDEKNSFQKKGIYQIGNLWKTISNLFHTVTEYNKHHLSESMKIVIPLKGGMFEIFYDLRCFAMFRYVS
uniref:hypothetical protein n=1 Tax=Succinivibrio sp. TaxID=2053619 RepID=UPI00386ABDDC